MKNEESGLFRVSFTEEGKEYIRRLASISLFMIIAMLFTNGLIIYTDIKLIINHYQLLGVHSPLNSKYTYYSVYPFVQIITATLVIISNFNYLLFPGKLLRSIESNDEPGANKAFKGLWTSGFIFFIWLIIHSVLLIWKLVSIGIN